MSYDATSRFLLSTVPGVVILSVVASLLAMAVVKMLRLLFRSLFTWFLDRLLSGVTKYFRQPAEARLLAVPFSKRNEPFPFLVQIALLSTGTLFSFIICACLAVVIAVYFIVLGPKVTAWLGALCTAFFFFLLVWLRDAFSLVAVALELVNPSQEKIKKILDKHEPSLWFSFATAETKEEEKEESNQPPDPTAPSGPGSP